MANTYIQGTDLNNPLGVVTASTLSGTNLSIASGGSILPVISGSNVGGISIGSVSLPFSGIYAKQYATTLFQPTAATGSTTINWNNGTTQYIDYTGVVSGTSTLTLSNGIAGSAYVLSTKQNATGTITLAWTSEVIWQSGISGASTAASGSTDLFSFVYNGAKYLGSYSNNYF